jgi:cytochrome c oxidase subunit 2
MSSILVFAAIVLVFVIILMIGRANDMAVELEGGFKDTSASSKRNAYLLVGFLVLFFWGVAVSLKELAPMMIPKAASIHGEKTDFLFYLTLAIIFVVFVITHIVLIWFAFRYNESKSKTAYFYPHNNKLELVWTAVPAVVMVILVVFGMKVWLEIFDETKRDTENMMVIEVTGKQFNWIVRYPGPDGKLGDRKITKENVTPTNELGVDWNDSTAHDDFFPDKLYLVKNKPVLVKLGALDVLHSFYLPHFRVKMDCVPGVPTSFYFTPTMTTAEMQNYLSTLEWWQQDNPKTGEPRWKGFKYELACTELCGKSHYGMQREVVVVDEVDFDKWQGEQKSYYEANVKQPEPTAAVLPAASTTKP